MHTATSVRLTYAAQPLADFTSTSLCAIENCAAQPLAFASISQWVIEIYAAQPLADFTGIAQCANQVSAAQQPTSFTSVSQCAIQISAAQPPTSLTSISVAMSRLSRSFAQLAPHDTTVLCVRVYQSQRASSQEQAKNIAKIRAAMEVAVHQ